MKRQGWDRRYAGMELVCGAEPTRFLAAEVDALPTGRALDLGCSEGRNAIWLAQRGWEVTGRAVAALGPGGTLLVIGHDRLKLIEGHGGPWDPEVLFTPAGIEHGLPGLLIERAERVPRPVTVDGREVDAIDAIDALVRANRPVAASARSSVGREPLLEAT